MSRPCSSCILIDRPMKKIFKLSIFMVLLTLASSCNTDEAGLSPSAVSKDVTILAGAPQLRTVLVGDAVKWEKGDEIAVVFTHPSRAAHVTKLTAAIEGSTASTAAFSGKISPEVTSVGAYDDLGYAVYPSSAVASNGKIDFTLPTVQQVRADGSFAAGINLSSAQVSISDLMEDGQARAMFQNALAMLRFTAPANLVEMTVTGTSPFTGKAPLVVSEDGSIVIDETASWSDRQMGVTIRPAAGASTFTKGTACHFMIYPGTHTALTIRQMYSDIGPVEKTINVNLAILPAKYYNLKINGDSETLITELKGKVEDLEQDGSSVDGSLEDAEEVAASLAGLMSQIQSVALMTEYLDNSVYAPYAAFVSGRKKMDVRLDYIIRPAAVAAKLVQDYPEAFSALSFGQSYAQGVTSSKVNRAELNGDVLSVYVDANGLSDSFYAGSSPAQMALQISDGNTEILSDFAKLVPKQSMAFDMTRTENIPVLKGAMVSIPFKYAVLEDGYSISVSSTGFPSSSQPYIKSFDASKTGYVYASFGASDDLSQKKVEVTLTSGGETFVQTLTFADGGKFNVVSSGAVDYIGGEVSLDVTENNFGTYSIALNGGGWARETNVGVGGLYSIDLNSGAAREASVTYTFKTNDVVNNGDLTYTKSVAISQLAYGSALTREYYKNADYVMLNRKSAGTNALNIVILGDGYQKKDLLKGGKFERTAKSAMGSLFGIEPFKSFMDRFDVYMVAYESADEGIDINSQGVSKNTYFDAYWSGNSTAAYCSEDKVVSVVKNTLGLSTDAKYYRTVAIVLANTDESAGSCGYPYRNTYSGSATGESYASFAIAVLAANSTATSGLIKHEAGGHAFGRLGDEYLGNGNTIEAAQKTELNTWHSKGFYRNLCTDRSYWNEFVGRTGYSNVGYFEGGWNYQYGVYRPTESSMMLNNSGTFNAPSRRIIYERIMRQSSGSYSFDAFLEYDRRNL